MPFVKLDCGILDSTLWVDLSACRVFQTALLMAEPHELREPTPQLEVRTLARTDFLVPAAWYGFVRAAGVGIVRRALLDEEEGLQALERLGAPEPGSRNAAHNGRRLVRVDGGYIVLNFQVYRDRDYTAAERSARYRAQKRGRRQRESSKNTRDTVARLRGRQSDGPEHPKKVDDV